MYTNFYLQFIISLAIVIILILITLFTMKYLSNSGLLNRFINRKQQSNSRLKILDTLRIDMKRKITIIECDNIEYIVIMGENTDLLLAKNEKKDNN